MRWERGGLPCVYEQNGHTIARPFDLAHMAGLLPVFLDRYLVLHRFPVVLLVLVIGFLEERQQLHGSLVTAGVEPGNRTLHFVGVLSVIPFRCLDSAINYRVEGGHILHKECYFEGPTISQPFGALRRK